MIEWMSKGRDATAPSYVNGKMIPPVVEVIDFPDKATDDEIIPQVSTNTLLPIRISTSTYTPFRWNLSQPQWSPFSFALPTPF